MRKIIYSTPANCGFLAGTLEVYSDKLTFIGKKKTIEYQFIDMTKASHSMGCLDITLKSGKTDVFNISDKKLRLEIIDYINSQLTDAKLDNQVKNDNTNTNKENVEQNTSNENQNNFTNNQKTGFGTNLGIFLVLCAFVYGIYSIGSSFFGGESFGTGSDTKVLSTDRSVWFDAGYVHAESNAKKDIPEDAYVWSTLKASELTCETIGVSDKVVVVVKCSTTNDEVIKHYGSSTIYYGFQESADGTKYWHYASKDRDEAIQKVK